MKKAWIWVISVFALLILLIIAYLIYRNILITIEPIDNSLRVIDGDTFEISPDGPVVRLLCVDTPEEGEAGYEEAKIFLEDLLYNNFFTMKNSYYSNDTDEYGRLLMWVYIEDEDKILVNKLIVDEGYGDLWIIPPETCQEITGIIAD